MKILFVFDSCVMCKELIASSLGTGDMAYLFPLTSKLSITTAFVDKIKNRGCDMEIIQTARVINSAANDLRDKYIRFIAELPERIQHKGKNLKQFFAIDEHASLWWFSLISEKNTFKSDSFNILAQLDSIVNTIKHEKIEKMIFGCVNKKLQNALFEYSRQNSIMFSTLPIRQSKSLKVRIREFQKIFYLKHILYLLYFAVRFFFRTQKIKRKIGGLNRELPHKDSLMLITGFPYFDVSLAQEGIFKNKFYPHLQEALENKGSNINWIAMYDQNSSVSLKESLNFAERFIKNGHIIFFIEEFNTISVQLKALLKMLRNSLMYFRIERGICKTHNFGDYDFYPIFKDDWYSSFSGPTGYYGLIYYNLFKSLLDKMKAGKCLYFCEMQAWEKALISARNAVGCKTLLVGYQHSTVPPMLLNYFNTPCEVSANTGDYHLPMPDLILCNGRKTAGYMESSDWPRNRIKVVEAIRFNHLKKEIGRKFDQKKNVVLFASSISLVESSAMLNIIHEVFGRSNEVEVWIKFHPFLASEDVLRMSKLRQQNLHFFIKQDAVESLLPEVKAIIVGQTGVATEALVFGARVIILNMPEMINMSALRDENSEIIRTVSSPEELRQAVISILKEEYNPEMHAAEAKRIINDYFYLDQESDIPRRLLNLLTF